MRLIGVVALLSVLVGSVGAVGPEREQGQLFTAELSPLAPRGQRADGLQMPEETRALGDTCRSGVETWAGFFSGWFFGSNEYYGIFNDMALVDTCCWTTEIQPLNVCIYVVVTGEGAQGPDIEFLAHAELWNWANSDTCDAVPSAMICNGDQWRWSLPDPPDGSNWLFGPLCFPLNNCGTISHPTLDSLFAVVMFDSTGSGNGDDIHLTVEALASPCYDWVDWQGFWEDMDDAVHPSYTTSMYGEYECVGADVPVEMSSLSAVAVPGQVEIRWATASEEDNLGFNVYRAGELSEKTKINVALVPGAGTTSTPHSYSFIDSDVDIGGRFEYWVSDVDFSGVEKLHGPVSVVVPETSPTKLGLEANGWNGSSIDIRLDIPSEGRTNLSVYDLAGREVAVLIDQILPPGQGEIQWDGASKSGDLVASGAYIFRLVHTSGVVSKKAVLAR